MLQDSDVVCVAHSPGERRVLTIGLTAGSRMPLLTTAIGRACCWQQEEALREELLASAPLDSLTPKTVTDRVLLHEQLVQIRQAGYAIADEGFEPGVRSIAVPVTGNHGEPLAALNVIASVVRVSRETMEENDLHVLRQAAEAVALAMI